MELSPGVGGGSGGDGTSVIVDGVSSSIRATVFDLTNSNPQAMALVDANGDQITSFGGGTQYTDGAAAPANPVGTMPIFNNGGTWAQVSNTVGLPVAIVGTPTVVTGGLTDAQLRATPVPVSGTIAFSNTTIAVTNAGVFAVQAAQSGTWNITNISGTISLPTGASTLAEQQSQTTLLGTIDTDTGAIATSVASIDSKTPALGQALAAGSVPVVLTAAQITTLTPQTDALTDTELRATPVPVSLTSTTITGTVAATQSGAWTVTANAGTDLNTSALLTTAAFNAAFGTAGTPDTQVLSVQGIASMTPLLVDGSGSTQPISGTVTANQGTSPWVISGAVTNTTLSVVGNGAAATALRVTLANDSTGIVALTTSVAEIGNVKNTGTFAVQAAQSGTWNINNVSGTISLPTGAATSALQTTGNTSLATIAGAVSGTEMQVDVLTMPTVTVQATNLDIRDLSSTSDSVTAVEQKSATGTQSNVAGSASSVTLLSSNANRLGASIVNDSSAILYVKMGTTASATDYAVRMYPNDYFEVPFNYTGRIDGIWASATGNARVTEYT